MTRRILTALIASPILIYIILYAPAVVFGVVAFAAMLICMYEFFSFTDVQKFPVLAATGYILGAIIFLSFYYVSAKLTLIFPIGALLVLTAALLSRIDFDHALHAVTSTLFGAWYVGGLLGYVLAIRLIDPSNKIGPYLLLTLFIIIWAGDTLAFVVGKNFGRHPLTAISPRKTVEGSIGGLIFSMLVAIPCKLFFFPDVSFLHAIVLGAVVGIMGQIGDLAESLLKRSVKLKDSGAILPGHGGMLDRLDSLLFGAPAMYYYVYFLLYR